MVCSQRKYSRYSSDLIDLVGFYHCEVNDLKTHQILQSGSTFFRLSDLEIYMVWFRFKWHKDQDDWFELKHQLEFNTQQTPGQQAKGAGQTLIAKVNEKLNQGGGYSVKPLALISRTLSLVTYVYRKIPAALLDYTGGMLYPEIQDVFTAGGGSRPFLSISDIQAYDAGRESHRASRSVDPVRRSLGMVSDNTGRESHRAFVDPVRRSFRMVRYEVGQVGVG
ncbi:hypothetical protein ElyMa_006484500 [Elysia marginata]|uniref:Uncharacterized protein n=1 Tax=Elysia marginata TaxID=1093978 RepID=A0AAV4I0H7_9GAST|nr:hypothetical protein ElyMa_006484500 [Elysia marginata]